MNNIFKKSCNRQWTVKSTTFCLTVCVLASHRPCIVLHCHHLAPGRSPQLGCQGAQSPSTPGWHCCSWCSTFPAAGEEHPAPTVQNPLRGEMNLDVIIVSWDGGWAEEERKGKERKTNIQVSSGGWLPLNKMKEKKAVLQCGRLNFQRKSLKVTELQVHLQGSS